MSCHYSCSTCSSGFYFDLCSTCPSTRTLVASTCPCSSGFYQYQQSQCTGSSAVSVLDTSIINTSTFAFYIAIGLHYLIIVLTINRVLSIKLKKIIDFCQVVALIIYYRYIQTEIATRGLKILDAFNFSYLTNLVCTQSGPPYNCSSFQNLFGVGFSLILFFLLFLLSYFVAFCIYSCQVEGKQKLGFLQYWQSLSSSVFLLYLDQTVIQTTLSISRIAIINNYGILLGIPFLIMIVLIVRAHFTTINAPQQTSLAYRAKHKYFFLYDEYYHLNYIDHIFEQENFHQGKQTLKKPFYPQSNLMIIEILFKILLAASTIVFYQYGPYLFAYCCIFLLVVYCCIMKTFYAYQTSDLWFYYILLGIQTFASVVFTLASFYPYFIFFTALGLQILAIFFVIMAIYSWRKQKQGEMFKKTFQMQKDQSNKIANLQESESQLISNKNEEVQIAHLDQDNIDPSNLDYPGRQISMRNVSNKNSLPEVSMQSLKKSKQSNSNMNQSKPVRQISRKTMNYQNISNRLTVRNKNSNPQMLETINEPSKLDSPQNVQINTNKQSKNTFAPQANDVQ